MRHCLCLLLVLLAAPLFAQDAPAKKRPGVQTPGHILLPTQWSLRPAGKQVKLGDFPTNIALHPTERFAAILHTGYGDHEILIIDLDKQLVVSSAKVPQAFYGLAFGPKGNFLYASGG